MMIIDIWRHVHSAWRFSCCI